MTATMTTFYYGREIEITDDQAQRIAELRAQHPSLRFLGRLHRSTDCRVSVAAYPARREYFDIDHLGGVREAGRR